VGIHSSSYSLSLPSSELVSSHSYSSPSNHISAPADYCLLPRCLRARPVIRHNSALAPGDPTIPPSSKTKLICASTTLPPFTPTMAEQRAGHDFFPHSRGEDELQIHPESSATKPQEECDPQGSASHSAFTNESEPSHSALTNEPEPPRSAFSHESEPAQTHDHADAMVDPQNTAVESQSRSASNTAAGHRDGYVRCEECLRTHLPPCNVPQEDKDLLKRDPEAYKRKFNTDRKKRNRKNRSAREPPPPPVRGPSRVSRPAHASGSRPSASTARQNRPLPYPKLVSASSGARELLAQFASTSTPDQVAHTRALLAQTGAGPENQTKANLSRVFEDQLAQAAEEAAAAGDTPSAGP
jgi:hypothetical protein